MSTPSGGVHPSFETVYRTSSPYVRSTVRRSGVPALDVPDVTQSVFAAVHRRLHTLDPARPLQPWVKTIARRTARDHRALSFHHHEVCVGGGELVLDEALDAEAHLSLEQLKLGVRRALARVTEARRAVLVMHDCEGLTLAEIAGALRRSPNTVGTQLRLARMDFRAAFRRLAPGWA